MTDIDDTLTRDGQIESQALAALHALSDAGVPVLAITGRPMGWSRPFARAWPVTAIVAENGAVALRRRDSMVPTSSNLPFDSPIDEGLTVSYVQSADERARYRLRLDEVAARILREVPGAKLAQDSPGRVTDIAVDHSEFTRLSDEGIARVVALMRAEGMTATVSSIHINGWFGDHSKWSGACWMVRELWGRELAAEAHRWIYVGDSTNDQAMFECLPLSVGVANLMHFADQIKIWPTYITEGERGDGFAQVAQRVLAARR
jgi:HAD superfamily hydrolase (TIGR01484 family)